MNSQSPFATQQNGINFIFHEFRIGKTTLLRLWIWTHLQEYVVSSLVAYSLTLLSMKIGSTEYTLKYKEYGCRIGEHRAGSEQIPQLYSSTHCRLQNLTIPEKFVRNISTNFPEIILELQCMTVHPYMRSTLVFF